MNIELIKKYKKEFNHFINGGKLLTRTKENFIWNDKINKDIMWNFEIEDIDIIIDDEYSHLRKALCNGKTLEFKDPFKYETPRWEILNTTNPSYSFYNKNEYRIKQEEPQLKAGDFVRVGCDGDSPKTIKIFHKESIDEPPYVYIMKDGTKWDKCIKWDPSYKELCWFTNNKQINNARLAEFHSLDSKYFKDNTGSWKYCEPFLNSKPSWFKD